MHNRTRRTRGTGASRTRGTGASRTRGTGATLAIVGFLLTTLVVATPSQAARPNPGLWYGKAVTFAVKRGSSGMRVVRFRTNYSLGCPSAASGGFHLHRVSRVSFRITSRGRLSGSRRFPLKGSDRKFRVKVTGRFTRRRKARGVITWYFPGCRPAPRKWGATGPRRYPSGDDGGGGGGGGGGDACIWIPLPDGSGFICV
jgi:hypothetical protein